MNWKERYAWTLYTTYKEFKKLTKGDIVRVKSNIFKPHYGVLKRVVVDHDNIELWSNWANSEKDAIERNKQVKGDGTYHNVPNLIYRNTFHVKRAGV